MKQIRFFCWGLLIASTITSARAQLLISEYLANPPGTDSPFEYVELIAAQDIDFALNPFSVVFANNGTATTDGWVAGGSLTYGFSLSSGSVSRGEVFYVGGSSMAPTGRRLRVIDTLNVAGDGFGSAASGVLGNGGGSADGIAVFNGGISSLTPNTVPVDAVFFGTAVGSAVVTAGSAGYQLPINDLYGGGKLQSDSFIAMDPPGSTNTVAAGVFDFTTGSWVSPRTFALAPLSDGTSSIVLVPEPSTFWLMAAGLLTGVLVLRRRIGAR